MGLSKQWIKTAEDIHKRLPRWHSLTGLLEHAKDLGPYAGLKADADAIQAQRSLLADPDPVRSLLDHTADVLRQALNAKLQAHAGGFDAQRAHLAADADWRKLTDAQRAQLTRDHHLEPLKPVPLALPEELQDALDECSLQHWISRIQALPGRFDAARHAAVQLLKPNVVYVPLPKRTLNNAAELKFWLEEVEQLVAAKLKDGPVAL